MIVADLIALTILGIAALRGLFRGLIREVFSIGALAGAFIAVRAGAAPLAERLRALAGESVAPPLDWLLAAAGIAIAVVVAIAIMGRLLLRGARSAGLGWADRLGGAVLGTAEGVLVTALLLIVASRVLGPDTPALADSYSLAALEELAQIAPAGPADVAAPPGERAM